MSADVDAAENDISFLFDVDISSYTVNKIKGIFETTWFNLVLHGLRTSFNRILQSSIPIDFAFTDRYKELLLEKTKGNLAYPYAFFVVNDIDMVKEQINISTMARRGLHANRLRGNSVPMTYTFPFKMNITLNVLDSDVNSLFSIMNSIFLADSCRGFNFGIKAFDAFTRVKVLRTGGISFSDATISTEQESDFGTGHITCTFEINGCLGFSNLQPTVRALNVRVYTVDPEKAGLSEEHVPSPTDILDYTFQLKVSEAADGEQHTDKLYIKAGRPE